MASSSKSNLSDEIEGFLGCYLLVSRNENPRICGRTYIGFTVDPNRRIRQHNAGKKAGGAWRTSERGPWDMILLVHGFPNLVSALRFEWAWQHPNESRRLKALQLRKRSREKQLDFRIRILANMLRSGPWTRLSLTVRWMKEEYMVDFPEDLQPLPNVQITSGPVKAKKCSKKTDLISRSLNFCPLCKRGICKVDLIVCTQQLCSASFHLLCLARAFFEHESTQLLPINGQCPTCFEEVTWTDLIKLRQALLSQQVSS